MGTFLKCDGCIVIQEAQQASYSVFKISLFSGEMCVAPRMISSVSGPELVDPRL